MPGSAACHGVKSNDWWGSKLKTFQYVQIAKPSQDKECANWLRRGDDAQNVSFRLAWAVNLKKKLTSVFHASVLLLIMDFVITLSK